MYVVDGGALKVMTGQVTAVVLLTGLSAAPMYWAEVNDQVFYNDGIDRGIIQPDHAVLPLDWPLPGTPNQAAVTGSLVPGQYQVGCTFILADGRETGGT